jgi:hypothetical protein
VPDWILNKMKVVNLGVKGASWELDKNNNPHEAFFGKWVIQKTAAQN